MFLQYMSSQSKLSMENSSAIAATELLAQDVDKLLPLATLGDHVKTQAVRGKEVELA